MVGNSSSLDTSGERQKLPMAMGTDSIHNHPVPVCQGPAAGTVKRGSGGDFLIHLPGHRLSAEFEQATLFAMACPRWDQLETIADACLLALSTSEPKRFRLHRCDMEQVAIDANGVTLSVDACLVESIPLLQDVLLHSQNDDGGVHCRDYCIPFNPPGTVLAMVTVLLLLEHTVTVKAYLGNADFDTTLPTQTLVVRVSLHV